MSYSAGPKPSPPDHLRVQCVRVLPRLQLIPEFRRWLPISSQTTSLLRKSQHTAYNTLWHCFYLGAPLCVLLDLLGSPSSANVYEDLDLDNIQIEQERMMKSFISRVRLMETQGKLPYGEVLREEDLFKGTHQGFAKVLRTVDRLLGALQATFPGLYVLPAGSAIIRTDHIEELIDSERAHVDLLRKMKESAEILSQTYKSEGMTMECLAMYLERLLLYHGHILFHLDKTFSSPRLQEDWSNVFALNQDTLQTTASSAQRSYCVHYLTALDFLENKQFHASAPTMTYIQLLLDHLSEPLYRISDHHRLLQLILDLTIPTDCDSYDSICLSLHKTSDMIDQIDEIGLQLRTVKSAESLQSRIKSWDEVDPEQLEILVLDDYLLADATSGLTHSVFLYESMLLCCQDIASDRSHVDGAPRSFSARYPIAKWELGPALSRNQPLDILFKVPTNLFKSVRRVSAGAIEIDWFEHDIFHTHSFTALFAGQCDQWYIALQQLVSQTDSVDLHQVVPDVAIPSDDDGLGGRRTTYPRPWSLIGRKGPRSNSSSMIRQEHYEYGLPQSPNALPSLFYGLHDIALRSPSPSRLSAKTVFLQDMHENGMLDQLSSLPPPGSITINSRSNTDHLLDLTGKIMREGKHPCAHGGFADVWKCMWRQDSGDCKVAIKVLRARTDDPEIEAKMHKRLRRELHVWKRLNHENVLPLFGTVSDFGNYTAFVCPWFESGSVRKYLERCSCAFSLVDCLQLLCEVAAGLSYLHSFGVIHGDLTGVSHLCQVI
ncbi:hypothetical protein PILCRDRAFT_812658 [Piloderma croceum F 1598]|uniref:Protein kinase domain-containing protein n=1 Tax=Piloderma croceum (strain F 1598) TaxID=765440 RepID=A0A0C3G0X1_PILCF|nr:hypothetical protein PILCRDRAFT_812658 [Piloderma croceum F 1598]